MAPHASAPSIFVSIASYRDPDCKNTVSDLFNKAKYPDRINIGVCLQIVPGEDDDCTVQSSRPEQIRTTEVHASESRGACWARNRVQKLWRGEDYYFQIDSHMRFVQDWDEKLIVLHQKCPGRKPVISTYPLAFEPPDKLSQEALVTIFPRGFNGHGILSEQYSTLTPLDEAPDVPATSAFVGAGMLFASGKIVEEVPYDPYLYFEGEEITLAARLWTHGWNIFRPNCAIAYHDYTKKQKRPRHWEDKVDWGKLNLRAMNRIRHIFGVAKSKNPEDLHEIEKYGLGEIRSLSQYEIFSGLNLKARLYNASPLPLPTISADTPQQSSLRTAVFSSIWKNNGWNCAETRSGVGSSLAATSALRDWLPKIFEFLNIRILADVGCGDLNWMKELTPGLRLYFGYDIVPELVEDLRTRFSDRQNCIFSVADNLIQALPEVDAILCRDFLTHMPLDGAVFALKRFRQSGARHLIATTHSVGHNICVNTGDWYPIDLTAAPFNLPSPRLLFREGGTKALGVWSIKDLPQ